MTSSVRHPLSRGAPVVDVHDDPAEHSQIADGFGDFAGLALA
ncbi:hypothetical protein GZL_08735 [Streptomyces sp. 769]|nr:hypothetical protein GZL_08735 [Streptomyces sp. 769]